MAKGADFDNCVENIDIGAPARFVAARGHAKRGAAATRRRRGLRPFAATAVFDWHSSTSMPPKHSLRPKDGEHRLALQRGRRRCPCLEALGVHSRTAGLFCNVILSVWIQHGQLSMHCKI